MITRIALILLPALAYYFSSILLDKENELRSLNMQINGPKTATTYHKEPPYLYAKLTSKSASLAPFSLSMKNGSYYKWNTVLLRRSRCTAHTPKADLHYQVYRWQDNWSTRIMSTAGHRADILGACWDQRNKVLMWGEKLCGLASLLHVYGRSSMVIREVWPQPRWK